MAWSGPLMGEKRAGACRKNSGQRKYPERDHSKRQ